MRIVKLILAAASIDISDLELVTVHMFTDRAFWRTCPIDLGQLLIMPISLEVRLELCATAERY